MYGLNGVQRWTLANRLLSGSAKEYIMYEMTTTWEQLKDTLVKVFGVETSNHEVAKRLEGRRILQGESVLTYFIAMRNLAQQGNFQETDIIKYIVDGLDDRSGNAAPLY